MQNVANIYLANSPTRMVQHNREARTATQMLEKNGGKNLKVKKRAKQNKTNDKWIGDLD